MSAGYPSQSQFPPSPYDQPPRKSGTNWLLSLLLVGVGILLIGGAVVVGGVFYIASNLEGWVVGLGREAIVAMVEESELPADEKKEVITQVDRLVTAYKEKKIGQSDLERFLTELDESPAMTALTLYGMEEGYFEDSELSAAEKEQGRRTFQRVLRGVYEGKISDEAFFTVLNDLDEEPLREVANNGAESSDDALKLALVKLKALADSEAIPDEPFQLKISDEVKKLVDKALAGK
jgi:hypothetical protein